MHSTLALRNRKKGKVTRPTVAQTTWRAYSHVKQILLDADQEAVANKREGTRVVGESQVALQSTTQSETETEEAYKLLHINSWAAPVVQLVEHWPSNLVVVGSSPVQDSSSVSLSNTCLPLKCSVL